MHGAYAADVEEQLHGHTLQAAIMAAIRATNTKGKKIT